jgi:hypothetical protein
VEIYLTLFSSVVWIVCIVILLAQSNFRFGDRNLNVVERILLVVVVLPTFALMLMAGGMVGKFLLLPIQLFIDVLFGTSFW